MNRADATAAIAAILQRAEIRHKESLAEMGANVLGEVFAQANRRKWEEQYGGDYAERQTDEIRSEMARLRANELEMKRLFEELAPEEEAERADLASRRTPGGHYLAHKDAE